MTGTPLGIAPLVTCCIINARIVRCLTCSALLNVAQRKHVIVTLTVNDIRRVACLLLHGLRSQLIELLGYVTACALRYKCVDEHKWITIAWMNDPS